MEFKTLVDDDFTLEHYEGVALEDKREFFDRIAILPRDSIGIKARINGWFNYLMNYHIDKFETSQLYEDLDIYKSLPDTDNSVRFALFGALLADHRNSFFYTKYLTELMASSREDNGEQLESTFCHAAMDTEFDFLYSHKISTLYIEFLSEFQHSTETILNHYLKRLSIPHQKLNETYQSACTFIKSCEQPDGNSEKWIQKASKLYNKTKDQQFDLDLKYIPKKNQSPEEYWLDLFHSVISIPKKDRDIHRVIPVFENAILEIEDQELWKKFIFILYQYNSKEQIENYLSRYVYRFGETSPDPFIEYLRNITDFSDPKALYLKILPFLEKILTKDIEFDSWKELVIAQLSYLHYRTKLKDLSAREQLEILAKKYFEISLAADDNTFHSVERFIINIHDSLGNRDTAKSLLRRLTQRYTTESEGWLISYYFEKREGGFENALNILKAAINISETLDWPERIFEEALRATELSGSSSLYRQLKVRIEDKQKKIDAIRAQQQEQYQQQYQEQYQESYAKRKLDEDEEGDEDMNEEQQNKRSRVDNHRDRENLTISVTQIPNTASEKQIRYIFKDCGLIKEINIISLDTFKQATIEFTNQSDFLKALTKDYKKLSGREIRVQQLISTVWVANFPPSYTKENIEAVFGKYGIITSIRFPSLAFNSQRRFCYIEYATAEGSENAVKSLDGETIDGYKLTVKVSDPSSKQNRTGAAEEGRELYVSKLDFYKTTANKIKQLFSKYGEVENVHLPLNEQNRSQGKKHDGYGFVVFKNPSEAQAALELNLVSFEGRVIHVSISEKRSKRVHKKEVNALRDFTKAGNVIAIKNLPDTISSEQLKTFFKNYGNISYVALETDLHGAIIEFEEQRDAAKASLDANGKVFAGYTVEITTVNDLKKGTEAGAAIKRKAILVPSSLRKQISTLKISNNKTTTKEPVPKSDEEPTTSSPKPKSNDDFRKMFLERK